MITFTTRILKFDFYTLVIILIFYFEVCDGLFSSLNRSNLKVVKNEILSLSKKVSRGLTETPDDRVLMNDLFVKLEKLNKNLTPLKTPSLAQGLWSLEYTTSDSILGRNSYKRVGPILQLIDVVSLKAENSEVIDFFGLKIDRKVTAELSPLTKSKVAVQFKVFKIGFLSFNAPSSFKGELDITYVDEDMRLSRGDKGNIFVLTRIKI